MDQVDHARQAGAERKDAMVTLVERILRDEFDPLGEDGVPYLQITASFLAERVVNELLAKLAAPDHALESGQRKISGSTQ